MTAERVSRSGLISASLPAEIGNPDLAARLAQAY